MHQLGEVNTEPAGSRHVNGLVHEARQKVKTIHFPISLLFLSK